jgi:hypothetical protein
MKSYRVMLLVNQASEGTQVVRRIISLFTISTLMATMSLLGASPAFAQSCFDDLATLEPGPQPVPGPTIGQTAMGLAGPGTPESGTDDVARDVGLINQVRNDFCQ